MVVKQYGYSLVVGASGSPAFLRACSLAMGRTIKKNNGCCYYQEVYNSIYEHPVVKRHCPGSLGGNQRRVWTGSYRAFPEDNEQVAEVNIAQG
jgi:hypothetical protein